MFDTTVASNFERLTSFVYAAEGWRQLRRSGLPPLIANSEYLSMLRCIIDEQIHNREQPSRLAPAEASRSGRGERRQSGRNLQVEMLLCPAGRRSSTASLSSASRVRRQFSEFAAGAYLRVWS